MPSKKSPERFDVFWVSLDPTQGSEIQKTRPCVIISPNEMNRYLKTVVVAPMTSRQHAFSFRVTLNFEGKAGEIACDQIRSVDKTRLVKYLGKIESQTAEKLSKVMVEMFRL